MEAQYREQTKAGLLWVTPSREGRAGACCSPTPRIPQAAPGHLQGPRGSGERSWPLYHGWKLSLAL